MWNYIVNHQDIYIYIYSDNTGYFNDLAYGAFWIILNLLTSQFAWLKCAASRELLWNVEKQIIY